MRPILLSVSAREGERGEPGFGTRLGLLCLGPALGSLYLVSASVGQPGQEISGVLQTRHPRLLRLSRHGWVLHRGLGSYFSKIQVEEMEEPGKR